MRRAGSLVAVKTIIMKMSETKPALQGCFTRQIVFLFYSGFVHPVSPTLGPGGSAAGVLCPVGAERHPNPCLLDASSPLAVRSLWKGIFG